MGLGRAVDRLDHRRRRGRRTRLSHEFHHRPLPSSCPDHDHPRARPVARRRRQQRQLADRRRRRPPRRAHVEAAGHVPVRSLRHHRLQLFACSPVPAFPGRTASDPFAVRLGLARHPRECGPHARHRSGESRAHPQGLHDRRRHGRHRRCVARPDHRDRLARDTELPALGRRAGDPHPGRCRKALRRHRRGDHLHGRARPALRHQSAILVLLDRNVACGGCDLPSQWHPRRFGAADASQAEPGMSTAALSTRGLDKSFGSLVVAKNIEIDLPRGARYALIGPNGAGKTTLINLITGMLRPDQGRIFLEADEVTALRPEERVKRGLVRTFQINTLFPPLSALEAVTLAVCERRGYAGTWWQKLPAYPDAIEEAYAILLSLRLGASCYRPTRELAYGQQRLLEIALALATNPKVLLLDEPAAGVPQGESAELFSVIADLSQDIAVLFIEHDMNVVFRFARRIIVMVGGRILVEGTPAEIAADARVREVYLGGAHHG